MSRPKKRERSDPVRVRQIARQVLDRINTLPEGQGRRVVKFLAIVYLRPQDCRDIEAILVPKP